MKKLFLCIVVQFFMCVCFANLSNAALRNLPWGLEWGDSIQKVIDILKNKYPNFEYATVNEIPNRKVLKVKNIEYGQEFSTIFGIVNNKLTDISLFTIISNKKDNLLAAKNIAHKIINTDYDVNKYYKLETDEPWGDGRRYTFLNKLTKLQFTYGRTKDGSGIAGLIISFEPRNDLPNADINKAIDDYYNIIPIKKDSLPFSLQWGDSATKVKSILQKECSRFLAESDTKLKNVLYYTAAIKSNVPAIIICTIVDNVLYRVSFSISIANNNNNKDVSNGVAQKLRDNLVAYDNAKIISSSFTGEQERSTLILPYASLDIVSVKASAITKEVKIQDSWVINIDFNPIPEDIAPSTKKHSIDEITDALKNLKK